MGAIGIVVVVGEKVVTVRSRMQLCLGIDPFGQEIPVYLKIH